MAKFRNKNFWAHFLFDTKIKMIYQNDLSKCTKNYLSFEAEFKARVTIARSSFELKEKTTRRLTGHPLSREHFSLKIDVRDHTIWNCILEL